MLSLQWRWEERPLAFFFSKLLITRNLSQTLNDTEYGIMGAKRFGFQFGNIRYCSLLEIRLNLSNSFINLTESFRETFDHVN